MALVVLLVGVLGLMRLQMVGFHANQAARVHTQALQVARELALGLERLDWADARVASKGTPGRHAAFGLRPSPRRRGDDRLLHLGRRISRSGRAPGLPDHGAGLGRHSQLQATLDGLGLHGRQRTARRRQAGRRLGRVPRAVERHLLRGRLLRLPGESRVPPSPTRERTNERGASSSAGLHARRGPDRRAHPGSHRRRGGDGGQRPGAGKRHRRPAAHRAGSGAERHALPGAAAGGGRLRSGPGLRLRLREVRRTVPRRDGGVSPRLGRQLGRAGVLLAQPGLLGARRWKLRRALRERVDHPRHHRPDGDHRRPPWRLLRAGAGRARGLPGRELLRLRHGRAERRAGRRRGRPRHRTERRRTPPIPSSDPT